jgi:hypothetical protein
MLLKITLLIFKLSSDLSIRGGSSAPPRRSVYYCVDHKEQGKSSGESSPDTSPCWKLSKQFGAVCGNDKSFLTKKEKKIQNGDVRSDHVSYQQKWIDTDLGSGLTRIWALVSNTDQYLEKERRLLCFVYTKIYAEAIV